MRKPVCCWRTAWARVVAGHLFCRSGLVNRLKLSFQSRLAARGQGWRSARRVILSGANNLLRDSSEVRRLEKAFWKTPKVVVTGVQGQADRRQAKSGRLPRWPVRSNGSLAGTTPGLKARWCVGFWTRLHHTASPLLPYSKLGLKYRRRFGGSASIPEYAMIIIATSGPRCSSWDHLPCAIDNTTRSGATLIPVLARPLLTRKGSALTIFAKAL